MAMAVAISRPANQSATILEPITLTKTPPTPVMTRATLGIAYRSATLATRHRQGDGDQHDPTVAKPRCQ